MEKSIKRKLAGIKLVFELKNQGKYLAYILKIGIVDLSLVQWDKFYLSIEFYMYKMTGFGGRSDENSFSKPCLWVDVVQYG